MLMDRIVNAIGQQTAADGAFVTVKTATRHHTRHPGAIPEDSDTQYDLRCGRYTLTQRSKQPGPAQLRVCIGSQTRSLNESSKYVLITRQCGQEIEIMSYQNLAAQTSCVFC